MRCRRLPKVMGRHATIIFGRKDYSRRRYFKKYILKTITRHYEPPSDSKEKRALRGFFQARRLKMAVRELATKGQRDGAATDGHKAHELGNKCDHLPPY